MQQEWDRKQKNLVQFRLQSVHRIHCGGAHFNTHIKATASIVRTVEHTHTLAYIANDSYEANVNH